MIHDDDDDFNPQLIGGRYDGLVLGAGHVEPGQSFLYVNLPPGRVALYVVNARGDFAFAEVMPKGEGRKPDVWPRLEPAE